jgi:hypothetical protein
MGAVAVTLDRRQAFGAQTVLFGTLTLSGAYVAGGDTVAASQFSLGQIDELFLSPLPGTVAIGARYVRANAFGGVVKAYDLDDGLQTANGDKSTFVANYVAYGR